MIPTPGGLAERRRELSEKIGRERTELAVAYRGLMKPFQYADTSVAGIKLLRKNGWVIGLAPSVVGLVFSFFGWEKKGKSSVLSRFGRKASRKAEEEAVVKSRKPISRFAGYAWSLFQVYRKVRPFFP